MRMRILVRKRVIRTDNGKMLWHGKIFSLWYTKKRKDATDVWLEKGVGAGRGGDGEWLSADVKAGNTGFRIESYGIFVSQIRGTFFFCSK